MAERSTTSKPSPKGVGGRRKRILVVDDEMPIRMAIETLLRRKGYAHASAGTRGEALRMLQSETFDLVITDLHMEHRDDGLDVVRAAKTRNPAAPVLVITGFGSVDAAVEAMKAGAYDFIEKPFGSIRELDATIEAALARADLTRPVYDPGLGSLDPFYGIIGGDPALLEIFAVIQRLSDTDATVLLVGESGTGKELFARAIHRASRRCDKPFVPVNCGAIPESLLESELFGSRKGAFTGASADRSGRFQAAETGTIFLDEIGDMPPLLQVKLLRVLQSREIQPVGAPAPVSIDVRVVAATNLDLEAAVAEGRFREDLFYRLNVIPLRIPPLRERPGDILPIANHYIERFNTRMGRGITGLHDETASLLLNYAWPGNVRELENMIERIVILKGQGEIKAQDLPIKIRGDAGMSVIPMGHPLDLLAESALIGDYPGRGGASPMGRLEAAVAAATGPRLASDELELALPEGGIDLKGFVEHVENMLIDRALDRAGGNKAKAARLLGLNRTTLVEKIKRRG